MCTRGYIRYGDGEGGEERGEEDLLLGMGLAISDYVGYSLMVTEHSLSAGTIAIQALLLRVKSPGTRVD